METDVKTVDDRRQRVYRTLLLFLLALFGPFVVGYQYLKWSLSSAHMTWFIATGIGSIENSDWTGNTWFLRTIFSPGEMDLAAVFAFFAILLLPRLIFAATASMYDAGRIGKAYVVVSMIPVIAVTAWLVLQLMTTSIHLGLPPGVLVSIAAPDVDSRIFLPTPFLLMFGFLIIRSTRR